ncbi:MAG: DMT family transporter, partial [Bacteroidota bacterium]
SLLSAIIYALTVVLFKSETQNYSWKELIFYQNFAGLFLLAPFFQFAKAVPMDYTLGLSYAALIGLGTFGLFFYGLRRLKASVASALMYMEVVSAITLSYFFMGEVLTWTMLVGAALIIGSSLLLKN